MGQPIGQFDPRYLDEMADGDTEFINELLATYIDTAPDLIEAIQDAAAERATEKGIYAAHTLKGSSRSIGADPLGELCRVLEEAARNGDMDSFAVISKSLPVVFEQLKREIAALQHQQAA